MSGFFEDLLGRFSFPTLSFGDAGIRAGGGHDPFGWLAHQTGLGHFVEGFGHGWLFGEKVHHVQHIVAILLVAFMTLALSASARSGLARAHGDILPEAKLTPRTIVELLMEGILSVMQFTMPRKAALRHFWIVGSLGFFILFSNLLGLIPTFLPPTENFNTTFACGTIVFVYYNAYALYRLGLGHISHMANPVGEPWGWFLAPLFLPLEIVSHCIRPVSLAIRLFCNIAGDHLVLGVFVGIFPLILPIPFVALGLFVALMQTFIFVLLSCVYIGEVEAIIEHHEHSHGQHSHGEAAAAAH